MAASTPTDRPTDAPVGRGVVIVGAGPAGLCLGAKLIQAGRDDFVILERAAGAGGTWRHNSYPGAACDVPSLLYSFSFFPSVDWTRTYAKQGEILSYLERFIDAFGLRPHLRLGVEVRDAAWEQPTSTWHVGTSDGEYVGGVLAGAVGMFNEAHWPLIPGVEVFGGTAFHSARWDHRHDLAGRTVAVIGSGASAVQILPTIAPVVSQLYLFQRQAQWVLPKKDPAYTDEDRAVLQSDSAASAKRAEIYALIDATITFSDPGVLRLAEEMGRQNLAAVEDPEVRRKLQPHGPYGCHRPLISSDFYPTFNRPHVEVVTEPIERVTRDGILTVDGRHRPIDTIVYATGFATTKFLSVLDVAGRPGFNLRETWADGAHALLGLALPGFPNLFMLYGPNTNNGSILHMIEVQADHIVAQVQRLEREDLAALEVTPESYARYERDLRERMSLVGVWQGDCHGYYTSDSGRIVTQWPDSMTAYAEAVANLGDDVYMAERWPIPKGTPS